MQEMQEQMNSMDDSVEFQEVESNHSGSLPYVPSQPAAIPSSRSMLSLWIFRRILWLDRSVRYRGNPRRKVLETGTIHAVHATSSKYPTKYRTVAWKNTSQNSSSAKSLRYEI